MQVKSNEFSFPGQDRISLLHPVFKHNERGGLLHRSWSRSLDHPLYPGVGNGRDGLARGDFTLYDVDG